MDGQASAQDWEAYPPGQAPPPGYGQPAYGPPPGHGPSTPQPYAPQPYAPQPYAPQPYAPHGWPQPGYGPYGPGYPPALAVPLPWPHGPGRPGIATAAAVLGFVTAGLTALVMVAVLLAVVEGTTDPATLLMLLGVPCAITLVAGAAALLDRRSEEILFRGALASVAVLVVVLLVGMATLSGPDRAGMGMVVVVALPLPILTAVFAARPVVRAWVDAG
ncbi:hypothetical protein [Blastococcus litoris]|uniref:hypothetical protein n=1 Tax=Blastococcus litoris TaxID=2171622 RepID=UPI000E304CA1|nr:hypothetical protein [Blastococcus litoris]